MQIRTVMASIARRWYAVVAGLLVTGLLCVAIQMNAPDKFKAQASLVLMPSSQSIGAAGNPYLYLGGMSEALDILIRKLTSQPVKERVLANFGSATYTAEPDRGTNGAILVITANASSPEQTMALLKAVMDETPRSLNEMQEALNVAVPARITTMNLLVDRQAAPEVKARTQLVLVAAAGGLVLTLVISVLLDGLLRTRKRRKDDARRLQGSGDVPAPDQSSVAVEHVLRAGNKHVSKSHEETGTKVDGVLPLSSGPS
ncbi:hypothetical protein ACIPY2_04335 [Paenarthrobacter sp. NPDC089675]|uniref:hypothetical protein n=1 Tax=Paenarthrobacter sp. NPDC089675 TaxID=3364376 RepID=UPI0037FCE6E8